MSEVVIFEKQHFLGPNGKRINAVSSEAVTLFVFFLSRCHMVEGDQDYDLTSSESKQAAGRLKKKSSNV